MASMSWVIFIWSMSLPFRPIAYPPFRPGSSFKLLISVLKSGAFGVARVAGGGVVVVAPVSGWWSVIDWGALLELSVLLCIPYFACSLLVPIFVLSRMVFSSFSKKDTTTERTGGGKR